MIEPEQVERSAMRFEPAPGAFERLLRRQERRHRRQRVAAGIVGVAIAVGLVAGGAGILRSSSQGPGPLGPSRSEPPGVPTFGDLYEVDPVSGAVSSVLVARGDQWGAERSPVDDRIAYVSLLRGSNPQVYVRDADGTQRQLTFLKQGAQDPTWSPDGSQIAFASRGWDGDIYTVDAAGGEPRLVGGTGRADYAPDWSPDARSIVFDTTYPNVIYTIDADGGKPIALTHSSDDYQPVWSPDGRWIAFTHYRKTSNYLTGGAQDLWLIRPDGSEAHRLAERAGGSVAWSPDGSELAFVSAANGYVLVDAESGSLRRLGSVEPLSAQVFPLGQEKWRWIGDVSAISWSERGILTAATSPPRNDG